MKYINFTLFLFLAVSISGYTQKTYVVSTLAGNGEAGSHNGAGANATFKYPQGIAVDKNFNVFIADYGNGLIRKISPDGIVSTVAGKERSGREGSIDGPALKALFYGPNKLIFDNEDNLIICDLQKIRKLDKEGNVTTIAGNGRMGNLHDGPGINATFWNASGLAVDKENNIYVADYGHQLIRKINKEGIVSTFAAEPGVKVNFYSEKKPPHFDFPAGVAVDSKGNVFVSESYDNKILKITAGGIMTTFAGNGRKDSTNGYGVKAGFNTPQGLVIDIHDNLYVADLGNNQIRMITPQGLVSVLAGNGERGSKDGEAKNATFHRPDAIAIDKNGTIYVAELENNKIRKIKIQ